MAEQQRKLYKPKEIEQRKLFNPKEIANRKGLKISGIDISELDHISPAILKAAEDGNYSVAVSIPNKDNKFEQMSRDAICHVFQTFLFRHDIVGVTVEPESLLIINQTIIEFEVDSRVSRTTSELKLTLKW